MGGGEPLKCQSEKVHEEIRFSSQPHWRDLVIICEPKIKLPKKNGTKFPSLVPTQALNWNTSEVFLLPKNSTRHTATSSCVNVEKRDSLVKGSWRVGERRLGWELEAFLRSFSSLAITRRLDAMSTHHTRLKTSKQVEQFNVDCFNWRDLLSLERIFERKWNVIWTPFWTFFEMDKSCVPVTKLAVSEKKCWHCGQSTYCIWFCSDNFCCWVLPGKGAFHQQFLKTLFDFGSMWQLRIDASTGEERTFYSTCL